MKNSSAYLLIRLELDLTATPPAGPLVVLLPEENKMTKLQPFLVPYVSPHPLHTEGPLFPLLLTVLLFSANAVSRGETAVSPAVRANVEGNVKSETWSIASRGMTIYGSSTFDAIDGPVRITHLNLRPDVSIPVGAQFGFDNLQLLFSVTPVQPLDMSSTFEHNVNSPITTPMVAFDQAWTADVVSENPGGAQTRPFDFQIELSEPFEFDPAEGNLLVDWKFGAPIAGQSAFDRDSAEFIDHQTIWAPGVNPSGAIGIFSVPTEFVFESVPEPMFVHGSSCLSIALAGVLRRRRLSGYGGTHRIDLHNE